ncbi:54S ribosomal protein L9, mitochondrial [Ascosphaera pollenicola]|nr:54S ribosomal protein L9, mitochondrial [Ascosphaera pollenicola]
MPPRLSAQQWLFSSPNSIPRCVVDHIFTRAFGIKPLNPPKPDRFNIGPGLPVLSTKPSEAHKRRAKTTPLRTGALAIKKGMTAVFDPETGKRTPCTVLQLDRMQVVAHKTHERHGYFAVQVGAGWKAKDNVTKPMLGHFAKAEVAPKRYLHEFKVLNADGLLPVGQTIKADWFIEGQYVDARSNSRGFGFTGVMKRHGFHGQDRSHGVSLAHRSLGSAGPGQGAGSRVHPGKKMAGRMGNEQVTVQSLKVLKVDAENGIVVIHGCIAGPKNCVVQIQDAIKKPWPVIPSASAAEEVASSS